MAQHVTQSDKDTLESLIDRYSLADVLDALSDICNGKATHLTENWQDPTSARHWAEMGNRLDTDSSASARKFGR